MPEFEGQQFDHDVIDLRQLGRALLRRRWILVAAVVVGLAVSYVVTLLQTPVYEAETILLIKDLSAVGEHLFLEGGANAATSRNRLQNGVQLLRSRQVAERATAKAEILSGQVATVHDVQSGLVVQPISNTETVRISVQHANKFLAAALANAVVDSFIELSQELNRAEVTAARQFIEEQLVVAESELHKAEEALRAYREAEGMNSLSDETRTLLTRHIDLESRQLDAGMALADAQRRGASEEVAVQSLRLESLGEQIATSAQRLAALPAKEIVLARLTREQAVLEQSFLLLRRRYEDARIAEAMRASDVAVIDRALPPTKAKSPKLTLNIALGGFLGMFLGLAIVLVQEFLDTSIKTPEDAESLLGIPVIGRIPWT